MGLFSRRSNDSERDPELASDPEVSAPSRDHGPWDVTEVESIGRPRALRAIGNALASNPVCVIVPCHRVVREDGGLGDYAGGVAAKQHLLNVERRVSTGP